MNPENPKKRHGVLKPSAEYTPASALVWLYKAMEEGAGKYGPFNWRTSPVEAGTYYSAAWRHINLWYSGQQKDPTTGLHHLGYAMACMAILIDAELNSALIDNRPTDAGKFAALMDELTSQPKEEVK